MASTVSYSNVHQLSSSDKMIADIKKESPTSMKSLLNQQASPDSTNNNSIHQTPTSMNSTQTSFTNQQQQQQQAAPRGRGRKSAPTYVQVIPGQPVAVARRNARERNRVKQVNNGFSTLRQHIPFTARNKKMSKVETLRCAVEYIRNLQQLLDENGGYDHGELMNVSSSSPLSSIDDSNEDQHSLISMGTTSDVMYETQTDNTIPSSSTILIDEYSPSSDYNNSQIRNGVLQNSSKFYHNNNNDIIFSDSPLPTNPNNTLIRYGSSLSPGYSDRSSVNNSPGALSSEVTTTHGFMGVFAAAAAGLDKNSSANTAGLMMDLSRNQQSIILKKERDEEDERRNTLLELDGANTTEMIDALTWWEIEQARRIQQQQTQTTS